MKIWIFALLLACFPWTSPLYADVLISLKTTNTPATTRPDADASTIRITAVPGHNFSAKFEAIDLSIAVNGSVDSLSDAHYRIKIKFLNEHNGMESVDTTVDLKLGEPFNLVGLQNGSSARTITMTLSPSPV
jgi:hypothetical protein